MFSLYILFFNSQIGLILSQKVINLILLFFIFVQIPHFSRSTHCLCYYTPYIHLAGSHSDTMLPEIKVSFSFVPEIFISGQKLVLSGNESCCKYFFKVVYIMNFMKFEIRGQIQVF